MVFKLDMLHIIDMTKRKEKKNTKNIKILIITIKNKY